MRRGLPLVEDLGSGSLVDLAAWGLPHEPTPQELLAAGADLVSFSGDKLLGGPQAGLIVGRAELIKRMNANPLKRALRLDKGRLAALEQVLLLYLDPARLAEAAADAAAADPAGGGHPRLCGARGAAVRTALPGHVVSVAACRSQIGSGALPVDLLAIVSPSPSVAEALEVLAASLRSRQRPVIGRTEGGRLWLDCRCLEPADEAAFIAAVR